MGFGNDKINDKNYFVLCYQDHKLKSEVLRVRVLLKLSVFYCYNHSSDVK